MTGSSQPTASGSTPAGPTLTGAQALVRSLEEVGADVVFGIPGGAILPAYDPLYDSTKVRHILTSKSPKAKRKLGKSAIVADGDYAKVARMIPYA